MPLASIERYAGPPLAERAWAVERAGDSVIRPGDRSLAAVMGAEAAALGTDPETIEWDSWRRPDDRWTVVATFDAQGKSHRATWIFDARSKAVIADDAEASRLATEDVVIPMRAGRRHHTEIIPTGLDSSRGSAVSTSDVAHEPEVSSSVEIVEEIEVVEEVAEVIEITEANAAGDSTSATDEEAPAPVQEALDVPAEPTPRKAKRGRRASVPSWDEILFGSQAGDD